MLNKRAQLGETLTWVVATLIIFVILFFFIFGSSLLGKTKDVKVFREKITSFSSSYFDGDYYLSKSLYAHFSIDSLAKQIDFRKDLEQLNLEDYFQEDMEERLIEIKTRGGF